MVSICRLRRAFWLWIIVAVTITARAADSSVAGIYRPYSANVGGAGRPLRGLGTPLTLQDDGTYVYGQTHGTYAVEGAKITFSDMTLHPVGAVDGNKINFEYDYQGLHHTLSYLRYNSPPGRKNSNTPPATAPETGIAAPHDISLELTVRFPASIGHLGSINTMGLIPLDARGHRIEKLATARDDNHTVKAFFHPPYSAVTTGGRYLVYVSAPREKRQVGEIDLRQSGAGDSLALTLDSTGFGPAVTDAR
jgi:hypothetical protein